MCFAKVSNSQEELLKWHSENGLNNSKVIHSTERCADGIIQAIGHFNLGPNLSPRDITEFLIRKTDNVNPGHEIVRFYLFYERLRLGEIKNYETYITSFKESCVSKLNVNIIHICVSIGLIPFPSLLFYWNIFSTELLSFSIHQVQRNL